VQKAEVKVVFEEEEQSFLASVKFCKPDSFLISLKSKTGIEAARILITNDTLLINDRINRILYFGSGKDFKKKYGYSSKLLPVLFGDFVLNNSNLSTIENCQDGVFNFHSNYEGLRLKYSIDCSSDRLTRIEVYNELNGLPVILEYSETRKFDSEYYYSKVHARGFKGYKSINIIYKKIVSPYIDFIEFVPGKNYEPVRIR